MPGIGGTVPPDESNEVSDAARSPLGPDDLARRVGRSDMRVRKLLRTMYPDQAPGSGGRWYLTERQVADLLAYFAGQPASIARHVPALIAQRPEAPGFDKDGRPAEWHWEGQSNRC